MPSTAPRPLARAVLSLAGAAFLAGCASARPTASPAPADLLAAGPGPDGPADPPGAYAVRNTTTCAVRVFEVEAGRGAGRPGRLVAEVPPGATGRVTLARTDRRLTTATFRERNAEPGAPGADCRGSGRVEVTRVAE